MRQPNWLTSQSSTVNVLRLDDSEISTSVFGGNGNSGNIAIDPVYVVLQNGSRMIAQASEGRGGDISIVTDALIQSPDSEINASSELGIDGNIEIDTLDIEIDNEIATLAANFLDANQWIRLPCAQRSGDSVSRLLVSDRDGAFHSPSDLTVGQHPPTITDAARSIAANPWQAQLKNLMILPPNTQASVLRACHQAHK